MNSVPDKIPKVRLTALVDNELVHLLEGMVELLVGVEVVDEPAELAIDDAALLVVVGGALLGGGGPLGGLLVDLAFPDGDWLAVADLLVVAFL